MHFFSSKASFSVTAANDPRILRKTQNLYDYGRIGKCQWESRDDLEQPVPVFQGHSLKRLPKLMVHALPLEHCKKLLRAPDYFKVLAVGRVSQRIDSERQNARKALGCRFPGCELLCSKFIDKVLD
jgi:hypothetical protein